MAEYIKRKDALGCVLGLFDRQRIKELPAADVAEVRRGKWIYLGFIGDKEMYRCDQCYEVSDNKYNYCPNCGTRMDKEE